MRASTCLAQALHSVSDEHGMRVGRKSMCCVPGVVRIGGDEGAGGANSQHTQGLSLMSSHLRSVRFSMDRGRRLAQRGRECGAGVSEGWERCRLLRHACWQHSLQLVAKEIELPQRRQLAKALRELRELQLGGCAAWSHGCTAER